MTLKRFIVIVLIIGAWVSGHRFGRLIQLTEEVERWKDLSRRVEDGSTLNLQCPRCKTETMVFRTK